jgi:hypothetical protein
VIRTISSAALKTAGLFLSSFVLASPLAAQTDKKPTGPLLTRTIPRHEIARLQFGGTVTLSAAPAGSIVIEGWQRPEVEVTATIELQAPTAADLDLLSAVNTFVVDRDVNHIRILTTGTHDRVFMKKVARKFPKALIGLPWKVDFQIKVPALTDLTVDAGRGPIKLSGVEGAIRVNALHSDADLSFTGGDVSVLIQSGTVNVDLPGRGWHGLGAEFRMASGNLNVGLAPGYSADVNCDVLRRGEIKSSFPDLKPREGSSVSPQSIRARAGNGGATLNFTVGDGTIEMMQKAVSRRQ